MLQTLRVQAGVTGSIPTVPMKPGCYWFHFIDGKLRLGEVEGHGGASPKASLCLEPRLLGSLLLLWLPANVFAKQC